MSIKIKVQNNSGCNYQNKKEDESAWQSVEIHIVLFWFLFSCFLLKQNNLLGEYASHIVLGCGDMHTSIHSPVMVGVLGQDCETQEEIWEKAIHGVAGYLDWRARRSGWNPESNTFCVILGFILCTSISSCVKQALKKHT